MLSEQNRKEHGVASKSAVHRRYFVLNHNLLPTRAQSPPHQSQAITQAHPTSILRRSQTCNGSQRHTRHRRNILLNSGSSIGKLVRSHTMYTSKYGETSVLEGSLTEPQLLQVLEPPAIVAEHLGQVLCMFACLLACLIADFGYFRGKLFS